MKETVSVAEIFGPTVQGEGALVGRQTVFVRTGGCDFRCSWCDSLHAVLPAHKERWRELSEVEILEEVGALTDFAPILITLSGGNPALQPMEALIELGHDAGHTFAMETQGSVVQPWFNKLDHLILSPKPPSSGMMFRASKLQRCIEAAHALDARASGLSFEPVSLSLKVVVMSEEDYQFAHKVFEFFAKPDRIPFFITPGNHTPPSRLAANHRDEIARHVEIDLNGIQRRTEWLIERCRQDSWFDVSIIPQVHTFLWGNRAGV